MKSKILAAGAVSVPQSLRWAAAFVGSGPDAGTASSHREAPLIAEDPVADKEDISYQFRFRTETRNPNTFLHNTGPIDTVGHRLEPPAVLQRQAGGEHVHHGPMGGP